MLELLFGFHLIFSFFLLAILLSVQAGKGLPDYLTSFKEKNTGEGDF